MSIKITPQTHGIVTWGTNGGVQASGPMTVSEGTTFVLQELRPAGYKDAAMRPLTDDEAAQYEASRLAFEATLAKHRKPVADLDLTYTDEEGIQRPYGYAEKQAKLARRRYLKSIKKRLAMQAEGKSAYFEKDEWAAGAEGRMGMTDKGQQAAKDLGYIDLGEVPIVWGSPGIGTMTSLHREHDVQQTELSGITAYRMQDGTWRAFKTPFAVQGYEARGILEGM